MTEPPTQPLALLVNGLPAAGKSTLAGALSRRLRLPLFSKDAIKETHADILGAHPPDAPALTKSEWTQSARTQSAWDQSALTHSAWTQRTWNTALGSAANQTLWTLLTTAPTGAVLESCWPTTTRGFVQAGLRQAGIERPLEIWCEVPLATARSRYEARHPRHPIHGALLSDAEWDRWGEVARPLGLGPVLAVDTTEVVDLEAVVAWIEEQGRRGL
jgi:predicted kinase